MLLCGKFLAFRFSKKIKNKKKVNPKYMRLPVEMWF